MDERAVFIATGAYWLGLLARSDFAERTGSALTWIAAVDHGHHRPLRALVQVLPARPRIGHIPISNLYEVFVLFALMTALLYLYYEAATPRGAWAPS